jgi:hypothetical protein
LVKRTFRSGEDFQRMGLPVFSIWGWGNPGQALSGMGSTFFIFLLKNNTIPGYGISNLIKRPERQR